MNSLRVIDPQNTDLSKFTKHLADCIILTQDNTFLLQKRSKSWGGTVNLFGGHIETGETITQGLIRELHEELGAHVSESDLTFVGAITESFTNHTELIHIHFWKDTQNTITGCYECDPIEFSSVEEAISHPQIMDYTVWAFKQCQKQGLLI